MKKLTFFILLCVLFVSACNSANSNQTAKQTPTPIPDKNTPKEAIESFLSSKYPGWKLQGDNLDKEFNGDIQFDMHLQKDKEDKVITVILKKFQNLEGQSYWLLYEPTKLEIAQLKIEKLKEKVIENWKEREPLYSDIDNEPYDPRR